PEGVSMFEPMGGSAPKYTGTGKINPIAAINAVSMMLDQLGHPKAANRVMEAIMKVTGTKMKSQAAGKMGCTTSQVGDLVCDALSSPRAKRLVAVSLDVPLKPKSIASVFSRHLFRRFFDDMLYANRRGRNNCGRC